MTQAGRIIWPDSGTLRVNFLGDSVGYRGSFASTLENSWRYLMRARLESVGPCQRVAHYGALIAEQAHRHDGMYVPFTDLFDHDANRDPTEVPAFGEYTTDGFHPNDAGHRAIYDRYRIALGL